MIANKKSKAYSGNLSHIKLHKTFKCTSLWLHKFIWYATYTFEPIT